MQAQLPLLGCAGRKALDGSRNQPQEFRLNESPGRAGRNPILFPRKSSEFRTSTQAGNAARARWVNRHRPARVLEAHMVRAGVIKSSCRRCCRSCSLTRPPRVRIDPFTRGRAEHDGRVNRFHGRSGTTVFRRWLGCPVFRAASAGLIHYRHRSWYTTFSTRYAHCSKLLVKDGDLREAWPQDALIGAKGRARAAPAF